MNINKQLIAPIAIKWQLNGHELQLMAIELQLHLRMTIDGYLIAINWYNYYYMTIT